MILGVFRIAMVNQVVLITYLKGREFILTFLPIYFGTAKAQKGAH